jgi:hypothetical protein
MALTIKINKLGLSHKGSNGFSIATIPDVCKTPSPGGPVPIPYPNISRSSALAKGTTTIKVDGGNMAANKPSEYSTSNGDEPGTAGGVVSSTNMKESTWITTSFDVMLEGKGAARLTDKKFHNHKNTVNLAGDVESQAGPGSEVEEEECDTKYKYDTTPRKDEGQPILFGQVGVSPDFSSKGRWKGASISKLAGELKAGNLSPDDFPVQFIWVNGEKVVVNNRSLTTLSKAGKKPTVMQDMTGKLPKDKNDADNLCSVLKRLDEMGGKPSKKMPLRAENRRDSPIAEVVDLVE